MTKPTLKERHNKFQQEVSTFQKERGQTVVDYMVVQNVEKGNNSLSSISKLLRVTKERLLSSISKDLFKIENDTIKLV